MYILLVWPILPKHCLKIWNVTYTQYEGTDLIWRLVLLKVMHIRAVQDISWLFADRFTHKIARFVFPCLQSFQNITTKNTHICVSTEYFRCTDNAEFPINTVPKLSKWSLHPSDKNLNVNVFKDKSLYPVTSIPESATDGVWSYLSLPAKLECFSTFCLPRAGSVNIYHSVITYWFVSHKNK